MSWLRRIFYALVATAVIQVIYYYPQMPDIVASHFDGRGIANDWASRGAFFGLYLGIVLLLVFVFEYVPLWSEKRSKFGMKIPNRDYWLSAQRIDQTRAFFRRQMYLMGIVHLLLTIYAIQLAILANFEQEPRLDPGIGWALLIYFVFLLGWLLHFYLHFKKT
ncbi:MAG: DUF1648 domain-containing protein [Gammaproteobacteria bacterium]|nr:MAG: DUF1648 domain-containing protein [Gammaproteobacteria bacterium]UCH41713.1 MAG: DUF1648 domain-containing protein [Gammaproteobacteria bacterium]